MSSTPFGRLLLITHENLGDKMAGPGIRVWELAKAVGAHGVPVTIGTPFPSKRNADNVEFAHFDWADPITLHRLFDRADAVMSTGPVMARVVYVLGKPIEKPVIVDTYYVPEIEQIMLHLVRHELDFDPTPAFVQDTYIYLHQGDYFTCALNSQYDFWLGALLTAGRINESTLKENYNVDKLIGIVPLGLPQDPPEKKSPRLKGVVPGIEVGDKVLYWGGGIWDWTDPFTFMDALKIINQKRNDVRAVFGALHHFSKTIVPEMQVAKRLVEWVERENWLGKKVFFLDWVDYDQRSTYLLESDVGVSLAPLTLESRFAIRSRLMDHLWTGLPGVLSKGDEMANLLASVGLAKIVEPGDASGTAEAILEYLENPISREEMDLRLMGIREQMVWSAAVKPVVEFMRSPRRAPDADHARQSINEMVTIRSEWEKLRVEKAELQREVKILRNSLPVRAADTIGNFLMKLGIKI